MLYESGKGDDALAQVRDVSCGQTMAFIMGIRLRSSDSDFSDHQMYYYLDAGPW